LRSWGSFIEGRCVWQQEKSRLVTKEERVGVPEGTFVGQDCSRDVLPGMRTPVGQAFDGNRISVTHVGFGRSSWIKRRKMDRTPEADGPPPTGPAPTYPPSNASQGDEPATTPRARIWARKLRPSMDPEAAAGPDNAGFAATSNERQALPIMCIQERQRLRKTRADSLS
jgi:hypothetical protein